MCHSFPNLSLSLAGTEQKSAIQISVLFTFWVKLAGGPDPAAFRQQLFVLASASEFSPPQVEMFEGNVGQTTCLCGVERIWYSSSRDSATERFCVPSRCEKPPRVQQSATGTWCKLGNAGVANAGPLPRVGGVTAQAGVVRTWRFRKRTNWFNQPRLKALHQRQ